MNMDLIISARSKNQSNMDYLPLMYHGLTGSIGIRGGIGRPNNPYCAKISIQNNNTTKWVGVILVEMQFPKLNPKFFLPGFMYGRNRGETPQNVPNEFPRIREEVKRPSSPNWMVRGDRLSHPVALAYDTGKIYGFSASPYFVWNNGKKKQWEPEVKGSFYQYAGYTCSLTNGAIGYTLGYENAPWLFVKSHDVRERESLGDHCFELEAGETIELLFNTYEFEADSILDINEVIKEVYYQYHQSPRIASDVKTTVTDLAHAVYNDAWLPEDLSYSGQVFEDKISGGYRYNKIFSLSWTNGLSVAATMLLAALRLNNTLMREQAISCISNILEHSLNPSSGLPYDAYHNGKWSNKGWWFDGMHTAGHSAYIVGQAMYYLLRAYDYELRLKNSLHEDWLEFVRKVLLAIEKTKNSDAEYPNILSEKTGAGIEYDAFGGSWCMAALAYYSYLTGDRTHIDSLLKSEHHYHEVYIKQMECYGAPLDTDKATDSEGILAYMKAVRYLHALTKQDYLLSHMKNAFYYEFTFKFCYNSPIKLPPLSRIGWSSCGGSITSIANPHIHPMSSNVVEEMLYYVDHTEDPYVKARMMDTVGWGCQTYNTYDGEYDFGKKGWMSERFCYSEGLLSEKYPDGSIASTWFCLMPWASASIIDGFVGDYWTHCQSGN